MFSIPFVYISCALVGCAIAVMRIRKQNQPQMKLVPIENKVISLNEARKLYNERQNIYSKNH